MLIGVALAPRWSAAAKTTSGSFTFQGCSGPSCEFHPDLYGFFSLCLYGIQLASSRLVSLDRSPDIPRRRIQRRPRTIRQGSMDVPPTVMFRAAAAHSINSSRSVGTAGATSWRVFADMWVLTRARPLPTPRVPSTITAILVTFVHDASQPLDCVKRSNIRGSGGLW